MAGGPTPATDNPSATDSPLGQMVSNDNNISSAIEQAKKDRATVQSMALGLPEQLQGIKEREKSEIAALGPVPQLTAEEMRHYTGKPPEHQPTSLAEQWGSPAMFLAMIASAFTRTPLTNALNAGAAVMKAYQQRDFDAANTAYKQWKDANDTALKLHEIQAHSYEDALKVIRETAGDDRKNAIAELTAMSHAFNDKPMSDALAMGRYDIATQLAEDRHDRAQDMKDAAKRAEHEKSLADAVTTSATDLEAAKKGGDPATIAKAQEAYDQATAAAHHYAEGQAAIGKGKRESGAETDAQAKTNAEIRDARTALQKLMDGEDAQYGGQNITPKDFEDSNSPIASAMQSKALQDTIGRMRKLAGTPIVKGTTVEPVPVFKVQPKQPSPSDEGKSGEKGGAEKPVVAGQPGKIDNDLMPSAKAALARGIPRDDVRKRYIELGGNPQVFDNQFLPDVPPVNPGG